MTSLLVDRGLSNAEPPRRTGVSRTFVYREASPRSLGRHDSRGPAPLRCCRPRPRCGLTSPTILTAAPTGLASSRRCPAVDPRAPRPGASPLFVDDGAGRSTRPLPPRRRLRLRRRRVEVGVPAAALQNEVSPRDLALGCRLAALRADLERPARKSSGSLPSGSAQSVQTYSYVGM